MRNQRGIALLIAMILAVMLSLIGLSLTLASISQTRISSEFENHERALMVADAGIDASKTGLRGKDLNMLIARTVSAPVYLWSSGSTSTMSVAYRNPRFPVELRSIDFENLPTAISSRSVAGLLTPIDGQPVTVNGYSGRYFAKLSDNRDEPMGTADDPFTDLDSTVVLRVMGIHRTLTNEISTRNSAVKNAVAVVETMLKRDLTFRLQSPLSVYGHNLTSSFAGNSFHIDGYDHRGMTYDDIVHNHQEPGQPYSGIGCIYNGPGMGDAQGATSTVKSSLDQQQKDNVTGGGGTPSVNDDTNVIRNAGTDAMNVFNPLFLIHFATIMGSIADYYYQDGTTLSGNNIVLGTKSDPKITYANGDLNLSGSGSGAGILIVRGTLDIGGSFLFDGVVLVVGEGKIDLHGANKAFMGGMYVANVNQDGTFGQPSISLSGNCDFYMKSDSIAMGYSLLPLKAIAWREITQEIEP